jgi:hypothetical protein
MFVLILRRNYMSFARPQEITNQEAAGQEEAVVPESVVTAQINGDTDDDEDSVREYEFEKDETTGWMRSIRVPRGTLRGSKLPTVKVWTGGDSVDEVESLTEEKASSALDSESELRQRRKLKEEEKIPVVNKTPSSERRSEISNLRAGSAFGTKLMGAADDQNPNDDCCRVMQMSPCNIL